MRKRTTTILLCTAIVLCLLPSFTAAEEPFEGSVDITAIEPETTGIAEYINKIYNSALGLGALAALIMITAGGIYYAVSGTINKKQEGKDIIQSAILGLVLLLGAFIVLRTINPQLVELSEPDVEYVKLKGTTLSGEFLSYGFTCIADPAECQEKQYTYIVESNCPENYKEFCEQCKTTFNNFSDDKRNEISSELDKLHEEYDALWGSRPCNPTRLLRQTYFFPIAPPDDQMSQVMNPDGTINEEKLAAYRIENTDCYTYDQKFYPCQYQVLPDYAGGVAESVSENPPPERYFECTSITEAPPAGGVTGTFPAAELTGDDLSACNTWTFVNADPCTEQTGMSASEIINAIQGYSGTCSVDSSICCLLYTSPSPRDLSTSRMPSSA